MLQEEKSKPIIESIRDYFLMCPLLADGRKVNVDYLGTDMSYSINPQPCDSVLKKYVDGGTLNQFMFDFTSDEEYDEDIRTTIENSGFYEQLEQWIDENNIKHIMPELESGTPIKIEVYTNGYLFSNDANTARYQIQCRLVYEKRR